jgi:hypothetical protein
MPSLAGQTLSGNPLDLEAFTRDKAAVVIFSFSRAGGRDARTWAQHFSKEDPSLAICDVIFLDSVPRLFRPMVVAEIRGGMPPDLRDRTLLLFQQQTSWQQRLHVSDEDYASVLVLGPTGLVRWISQGPFTEALYAHAAAEVGR